jgi:hypothetical protein
MLRTIMGRRMMRNGARGKNGEPLSISVGDAPSGGAQNWNAERIRNESIRGTQERLPHQFSSMSRKIPHAPTQRARFVIDLSS